MLMDVFEYDVLRDMEREIPEWENCMSLVNTK